jgi:hypothetical protein
LILISVTRSFGKIVWRLSVSGLIAIASCKNQANLDVRMIERRSFWVSLFFYCFEPVLF